MNEIHVLSQKIKHILGFLKKIQKYPSEQSIVSFSLSDDNNENIYFSLDDHVNRLIKTLSLSNELNTKESKKINKIKLLKLLSLAKSLSIKISENTKKIISIIQNLDRLNDNNVNKIKLERSKITIEMAISDDDISVGYDAFEIFKENELYISDINNCLMELYFTYEKEQDEFIYRGKAKELLNKLITNDKIINNFEEKKVNFQKSIDNYNSTIGELNNLVKKSNEAYTEINTNSNSINEKINSILVTYKSVDGKEDIIKKAVENAQEITNVSEEAKKISEYKADIEKKSNEALKAARNVISIISSEAIADDIHKQENKENSAAKGWLLACVLLFLMSLAIILAAFIEKEILWKTLIVKILSLPIILSMMIFSMKQYIKRKNIADSYAYKKTLALSLTGFRSQINESQNKAQTDYLLKAINILTESPLNDLDKNHIKNELESLDKIRTSLIEKIISVTSSNISTKMMETSSVTKKEDKQI